MDDDALRRLIAARRANAQRIETEIIIACERAACGSRHKRNRPSDWNDAAWRRYLLAAQASSRFDGSLSRIYADIDALERLARQRRTPPHNSHAIAKDLPCQDFASSSSKNTSSATAPNSSSIPTRRAAPPLP
ncbi:hypothetical protein [Methylocella tundrae]|nr:hypothetical protein [Methylocella tundrae]